MRRPTCTSRSKLSSALRTALLYGASVRRVLPRGGSSLRLRLGPPDDRLVFVLGSPRSGTTFVAETIGALPGFVDLGEVAPLKAGVPRLYGVPEAEAARRIRALLQRVRLLGLVPGLRGVEQTPETAFVLRGALRAFPEAQAVHLLRDGRDVVSSLLERGWLRAGRSGRDDARLLYGPRARFWVEPERVQEFERSSDATRAAWAWRAYVTAARSAPERTFELRYERLTEDPEGAAEELAEHLGVPAAAIAERLSAAHDRSIGRYRSDLSAEQLADVEREAGSLLDELGYR